MSLSSSSASTPRKHKPSVSFWRNQALSKNSSPARLTYVIAEPEHSTQESKVSVDDENLSTLRRPQTKSLKGSVGVLRPGDTTSESGIPQARLATKQSDSSPSLPSRRTIRAARPSLVSMIVRAQEKKAVTLLESPVSVNGLLNIPTSAKGKEKDISGLGQEAPPAEKSLDVLNTDASGSNTSHDDIPIPPPPPTCIPSITPSASATHVSSSDYSIATHDSTSSTCSNPPSLPISSVQSYPTIDADPPGAMAPSDQPEQPTQSDNPTNTFAEESPLPKAPVESSASSKKEGSSWFNAPWLSWSSPAPNNSIANTPLGSSSRVNDGGFLTDEQRAKSTGKSRDLDGGDIDRQRPRQENINCSENIRERSREDDVKTSQSSQCLVVADDGADKTSMSITHGDRNGKTATHGNCLAGSTSVEKQNAAPTPTAIPIQTSSHVDKLKSPSTDPESAVEMSALTPATTTPPDATAVSAPSASTSDLLPSASGLTDAGPTTAATQTSSWWDYIGWKATAVPTGVPDPSTSLPSAASTSTTVPVPSLSEGGTILDLDQGTKSEDVAKDIPSQGVPSSSNATGSEPKVPKPVSASVPSDEDAPQGDRGREQAHEQQQQQPEQMQAQEPREPHHDGHTRNAIASYWYNPWSWSSSYPPVADTRVADEARANEESKKGEMVQEQPVEPREETQESQTPQPRAPQVSVLPEEEQPQPPIADTVATSGNAVVEHNPISATIDSHRSSWLSFFASTSSRALITKTITAPQAPDSTTSAEGDIPSNNNVKVDENGMEVMDIDDEAESPASQVSQTQPPAPESLKTMDGAKDKESKALSTVSGLSSAQGLVATLVRGRGRVRSIQGRVDADKDSLKDGLNSDTSSVRSGVGGRGSGTTTPVNGTPVPLKPGPAEPPTTGAGSLSSSPASTTVSLVKRASLSLTGVGTKASTATTANGSTTTFSATSTSPTTAACTTAAAAAPKDKNSKNSKSKSVSPKPSPTSKKPVPPPPLPNFVLPSWQETFHTAPRSIVPRRAEAGTLIKTVQYVSGWLFSGGRSGGSSLIGGGGGRRGRAVGKAADKGKRRASSFEREMGPERELMHFGMALPKAWDVLDSANKTETINLNEDVLRGSRRVVVIGVHGWFPGTVMRTVIGEPTGTSTKLANMMAQALKAFEDEHGTQFEKVTKIPLEGEGTVKHRVEKLYSNLLGNKEWMDDLGTADAILVATHSQGSVVSTHLLDRLIADKHIQTAQNSVVTGPASSFPAAAGMETAPAPKVQRVCCLAMCGIHLGPFRYLSTSSLFQPYIQYLESPAARELFEFQNTNSEASKEYVKALGSVLSNGVKMLYAASLNDQVVPIYSGLFTAASHPLILRALYIDGDAYNSSDFLANLLVLLLRILNSGIPDSGLLVHLSEATAGSLNGVGHSTPYEETAIFSLAVKYLFLTNDGLEKHPELILDPFNARQEQNDYEIPWALRDVIADGRVAHYFSKEIVQLRDAFREWHPRTSILRDLKRKLQPIQRLPASFATSRL